MTVKPTYFCDGTACEENAEWCYRNGGECCQTTNVDHSLSKKYGDKFPPTKICKWLDTDNDIEEFDIPKFIKLLSEGKSYNFPEGFVS